MKLSKEIKNKIKQEYKEFEKSMYAGKTKEERDELGQFFTPPAVSIKLIETFEAETLADKVILDPTCGSGNLLAACLIAGADLDKIFGNDFDYTMVKICRERLNKICTDLNKPLINNWQIHRGDAQDSFCLKEFGADYKEKLKLHFVEGTFAYMMPELADSFLSKEQAEFLKYVN